MGLTLALAGCAPAGGADPALVQTAGDALSATQTVRLTLRQVDEVANDPDYMGEETNGRVRNVLAMVFLVVIVVAAVAAIPLMIATGMGS